LIEDIWDAKLQYDSNPLNISKPTKIAAFFYLYLKKRFGNQEIICEWGYNFIDACARYKESNVDSLYFLNVLNGDLEESVFQDFKLCLEEVKNSLFRKDISLNAGNSKGYLQMKEVLDCVAALYPDKQMKQFAALEEVYLW
jgi:hypothetical protein